MRRFFHGYRSETVALTTLANEVYTNFVGVPPGMTCVEVEAPSATKENLFLGFGPPIYYAQFNPAAGTTFTDLGQKLTDRNTSTDSGTTLNAMATTDLFYLGFAERRARGLAVVMSGSVNSNASVLAGDYWNGSTWSALTIGTDGTSSAGATLAQSGLIKWTVPTDWALHTSMTLALPGAYVTPVYWVRLKVGSALSATVKITELASMPNTIVNANDSSAENTFPVLFQSNAQSIPPYHYCINPRYFGSIELYSTSITSACNVSWYSSEPD